MKKISILLILVLTFENASSQDPFEIYVEKDVDWYPSIFQLYIQQYAGIKVNRYLIDPQDITSIKFALQQFPNKEVSSIDSAIEALQDGKKVFFFIDNAVWGGLNLGTVYSGTWQRQMPLCSGFYIFKKKCFQKEGLNFHYGNKDVARKLTFIII